MDVIPTPAFEGRLRTLETLTLAAYVMLFRALRLSGGTFEAADLDFRASIMRALEDTRDPEVMEAAERAAASFLAELRQGLPRSVN